MQVVAAEAAAASPQPAALLGSGLLHPILFVLVLHVCWEQCVVALTLVAHALQVPVWCVFQEMTNEIYDGQLQKVSQCSLLPLICGTHASGTCECIRK